MWITFNLINDYTQANTNRSISHFKTILAPQNAFDVIVSIMQRNTEIPQINFFNNA